ncbi:prolyl oligopeptidase family serine peptidase [Sphingobacterium paludis]|uniref:Prolyl oligopeptidase family protein n=1 Tax=Sphingobacterium paludis TaxID=1476465 RepID=A0A4R7CZF1_9SPHI|nr:prolyl oligopeptidase family serine peptidase [Sphingobacterium paludis]TDS13750.1 prolyl oligopeptidase family protein [Sphingobacterium paludis]
MNNPIIRIISLYVIIFTTQTYAQETYSFREGLYLEVPYTYGREAIYTDQFLWSYYGKDFKRPVENAVWDGMNQSAWVKVSADTSGFFRPQRSSTGDLRSPNNPPGPGRIAAEPTRVANPNPQQFRGPRSSYLYLSYTAEKEQAAILQIKGNSAVLVNGELHAGDPYRMGYMLLPIQLKKGRNDFFVRGAFISANLQFPTKAATFATADLTLPDIVQGRDNNHLKLGIVVVNNSAKALKGLHVESSIQGKSRRVLLPTIPARTTRKVAITVDASTVNTLGENQASLQLLQDKNLLDDATIALRSVTADVPYRVTFTSEIDNSVQYYAVNPAKGGEKAGQALFFSVHGAGVEALGQAQAYTAKDWGTLIAPTNRRPRGFNWEDWGRLDALEVLQLAKQTLQPDTQKIYLTGHSMGGHGTWFLGATYPNKWAAIAPCAGYPTLKGYGSADGLIPEKATTALEKTLLRASNQSDVIAYASNYKNLGVYILHGDDDRTVSVDYARQMRGVLGEFHPDFSYYEYPGGSHWYSNESVDWKPLFDYFKWHERKPDSAIHHIDFKTANPGISANYAWATIYQQITPLKYAHLQISRDIVHRRLSGETRNIATLALDIRDFHVGDTIAIQLDSLNTVSYHYNTAKQQLVYLHKRDNQWRVIDAPSKADKGPHRNGTFKEAFNHRMLYVYGTKGSPEENAWAIEKSRYDAESWYYRGNGAFDIIADVDYNEKEHGNRNIILVGNAQTNSVWKKLLADCPIAVVKGRLTLGDQKFEGMNIGGYFQWKRTDNDQLSVAVITGTGLAGMRAATANQYFAGASGFPDYMFFHDDMLKEGASGVISAGYYTNQWKLD